MSKITRRTFIEGTGTGLIVAATMPVLADGPAAVLPPPDAPAAPRTAIRLVVNGTDQRVEVEDHWTLAEVLRDHLHLTGTKVACDRGECGACTVRLDGAAVYSCSVLAVWADGRRVETIEGLAPGGHLHPLQQAFIDYDGPQCGFCTSGQLMSARALLERIPHPSKDEVRAGLAGNICRCSNYNHYVDAVLAATKAGGPATGGAA